MCLMKLRWQIPMVLLVAAGCSGRPGAVRPADVNAASAARRAIELFDKNGDGQLAKDEWANSPALSAVAATYDKDRNHTLTADEISAGINEWKQAGVGARVVPFTVQWNGQRLSGAKVRLVPAPFLDDVLKPATGDAGPGGAGQLSLSAEDRPRNAPTIPLMQPGLYQVEITHPTTKIPAKYNSATTLGIEITSGNPGPDGAVWNLTSK
jgi:hypothetical protein